MSRVWVALLCGLCSAAHAQEPPEGMSRAFYSGNELFQKCTATDGVQNVLCVGYVAGIMDALSGYKIICAPVEVTTVQAKDIVVKYLRENPGTRHYTAVGQVTEALRSAFPCKQ